MPSLFELGLMAVLIGVVSVGFVHGKRMSSIVVEQPWARATPVGALTGAVYLTLVNKTKAMDRLTGASSDLAAKVQIYDTKVVNGVIQLHQFAGGLAIPAGGSLTLKPGGYHVMLIGLKKQLIAGQAFPLTLTFAEVGDIAVTVPVRATDAIVSSKYLMSGLGCMRDKPPQRHGLMEL